MVQNRVDKVGKAGGRYVIHSQIIRKECLTLHSPEAAILVVERTSKLATTGSYLARLVSTLGISLIANTLSQKWTEKPFFHNPSGADYYLELLPALDMGLGATIRVTMSDYIRLG